MRRRGLWCNPGISRVAGQSEIRQCSASCRAPGRSRPEQSVLWVSDGDVAVQSVGVPLKASASPGPRRPRNARIFQKDTMIRRKKVLCTKCIFCRSFAAPFCVVRRHLTAGVLDLAVRCAERILMTKAKQQGQWR
jgi:hypothetical protein